MAHPRRLPLRRGAVIHCASSARSMSSRFFLGLLVSALLIAWLAYRTFFVVEPAAPIGRVGSEVQQDATPRGAEIASGAAADIGRARANIDNNRSGPRPQWSANFGSNAQASASDVRLSLSAPGVVRRSSQFRVTIDADAVRPVNRGTFKI